MKICSRTRMMNCFMLFSFSNLGREETSYILSLFCWHCFNIMLVCFGQFIKSIFKFSSLLPYVYMHIHIPHTCNEKGSSFWINVSMKLLHVLITYINILAVFCSEKGVSAGNQLLCLSAVIFFQVLTMSSCLWSTYTFYN
jgi:hypothetical protein